MVTLILTLMMCALLFLMIWAATYFYPWEGLLRFFPKDIEEKARLHQPPFPAAPVIGWILMLLCALGFVGVIVYGGWDGVRKGFTFGQFLVRFLVILLGMKAFDIIVLDYILITKTQFFQHYIPETKGCAGYHSFGYNRKEQLTRIVTLPFAALLTAWVCTLF
jgi:hypothetical protein